MSGDLLRERLRDFLVFVRPKLIASGADLDRLSQLRRLSDVRIRQFSVGRSRVTVADLCAFLADPRTGRFDALADAAGLLRAPQLAVALEPLGEDMGLVVEAALLLQVLGPAPLAAHLKDFVAAKGALAAAAPGTSTPAVRPAAPALPPKVAKLLGPMKELWAVPAGPLRILQLLESPEPRPDEVAAALEKDPALAARCLRLVNAAGFGQGSPVTSMKRAVVALGYAMTHRITAIAALLAHLGRVPDDLPFDVAVHWTHSLRTAHAASLVARETKLGRPDEHFAAGILHDIGKLVLLRHLPGPFRQVLDAAAKGERVEAAEARLLGVDHALVGACVCERWRFPVPVCAAARHHLDAADALEEIQLPREALVVAAVCRLVRDGTAAPELARWAPFLRLPPAKLEELRAEAVRRAQATLREFLA